MEKSKNTSRRKFLENSAAIGALGAIGVSQILKSCQSGSQWSHIEMPTLLEQAPDGQPLRAGVIGCGGRGTGAAQNFLNAGPNLSITAVADVFQDRVDSFIERLGSREGGPDLSNIQQFTGFEGFQRLIDEADVDVIITATPPYFRPSVFEAAVNAGKHVFMEKPLAVDAPGCRRIIAAARQAEAAGLKVQTGTQRRSGRDYLDIYAAVQGGAIGDIVSLNMYWNGGKLWHYYPQPDMSEMENMIRNWVNWIWLSGDHIVEQHVHNLDVANWFMGSHPVKAAFGMGSRQRRVTGDQFDNFSIDFVYENDIHLHSMCRQINDCSNYVGEYIRGTNGYTNCADTIWNPDGSIKYQESISEVEVVETARGTRERKILPVSHMDQEHVNLVTAIRTGEPLAAAEATAISTLTAVMGRTAAYTGREVTWDEMMESQETWGPPESELALGTVDIPKEVPVAGSEVDPMASARNAPRE
jgi:predicted dehydrogenase